MDNLTTKQQPTSTDTDQPSNEPQQSLTAEERKQFEEWKARAKDIEPSKSDSAIIDMATSAMIDAIARKACTSIMILYNTYQRIYKFAEVGKLILGTQTIEEVSAKRKIGEFSMTLQGQQCKLKFDLLGADIEVKFTQKIDFQ